MSALRVVLLLLCAAVCPQAVTTQFNTEPVFNPERDDVFVLLMKLTDRVEKLERKLEEQKEAQRAAQGAAQLEEQDRARVAFSASLVSAEEWTYQGVFDDPHRLLFSRVTTNIGDAYDPTTGFFTAPLKGVYYIRLTGCVGLSGSLNAAVLKNGVNMFALFDTRGTHGSASNGMTLVLQQGDQLSVTLWPGQSIFDQSRLSTFTGFLLFPL